MNAASQQPDWITPITSWIKRRILGDKRERWNHQYAEGRWEKLKAPLEVARLDLCAAQIHREAANGAKTMLEIGCGEALLQQRVGPATYTRWVGIDISDCAIASAQAFSNEKVSFVTGDMTTFATNERFDVVIFPESIYYVDDCAAVLRRYAQLLNPNGTFIISIFETKRSSGIWKEIHTAAYPIYTDATSNELGSWYCETLKPKSDS